MSTAVLARKACTKTNNHINFVHESARLHPNILTDGKEFKKNNTIILTLKNNSIQCALTNRRTPAFWRELRVLLIMSRKANVLEFRDHINIIK